MCVKIDLRERKMMNLIELEVKSLLFT